MRMYEAGPFYVHLSPIQGVTGVQGVKKSSAKTNQTKHCGAAEGRPAIPTFHLRWRWRSLLGKINHRADCLTTWGWEAETPLGLREFYGKPQNR